jgi:hypothetical protein
MHVSNILNDLKFIRRNPGLRRERAEWKRRRGLMG